MKSSLVIFLLLITVGPICTIIGLWLAKNYIQSCIDRYDQAKVVAERLNAQAEQAEQAEQAAGGGGNGGGNGGNGANGANGGANGGGNGAAGV
jgi:uncharacterized membrane protein YgcG